MFKSWKPVILAKNRRGFSILGRTVLDFWRGLTYPVDFFLDVPSWRYTPRHFTILQYSGNRAKRSVISSNSHHTVLPGECLLARGLGAHLSIVTLEFTPNSIWRWNLGMKLRVTTVCILLGFLLQCYPRPKHLNP